MNWNDHKPVIWAAGACAVMSGAAIAAAIPAIDAALSGADGVGLWGRVALILPAVVIMALGPWVGRQTGRVDQRKGFAAALCALAGFGLLGGFATGHGWLLVSRIGLGIATAAVLCFATAAIPALFDGRERGETIDRQSAFNTLGGVVFALAGGLLAQWGWRMPFLLYLLALPVAWQALRLHWPMPVQLPKVSVDIQDVRVPLATLALAMMAFYLIPVQSPFMAPLADIPALAGLTIASATLIGGLMSWQSGTLKAAAPTSVIQAGAIAALLIGLIQVGLSQNVPALLMAAGLIGAGFGALLPLLVQRILGAAQPGTQHVMAGLIASALYAGQVSAFALALALGAVSPGLPFIAMAFGLGVAVFFWVKRDRIGPWRQWIIENAA